MSSARISEKFGDQILRELFVSALDHATPAECNPSPDRTWATAPLRRLISVGEEVDATPLEAARPVEGRASDATLAGPLAPPLYDLYGYEYFVKLPLPRRHQTSSSPIGSSGHKQIHWISFVLKLSNEYSYAKHDIQISWMFYKNFKYD